MQKLSMKRACLHFVLWFLLLLGVSVGNIAADSSFHESDYPLSRQIQYSFTLQNKTNRVLKKAAFWTYAPVKQTATQYCLSLETSHPHRLIVDDLGNQILHFTFKNLPPYATKIIAVKANLKFSDTPIPIPVQDMRSYLQPEEYVESDAPEISRLAEKFKSLEPINIAKEIFNWVANNIKYTGYLKNDRGALYALRSKQGDCTEYMYLFTALCRANNIPARGVGGYVYSGNNILTPSNYHNWAEFYAGSRWKIADPQNKIFTQNQANYIAMRIIGKSPQNSMQKSHRFRVSSGLKVKMNKLYILTNF